MPRVSTLERPRCGDVLCSSASAARFLVIEIGTADAMPSVAGAEMVRGEPQPCSTAAAAALDCDLHGGQLYVDTISGVTLLCIRPGRGPLCYRGRPLTTARSTRPVTADRGTCP